MNRMLMASLTALTLMGASVQQASAYCKFNFGVGMNLGMESGGNTLLWGAFSSAPAPGMACGGDPGFGFPAYGGAPYMGGFGGDGGLAQAQPMSPLPGMAKPVSAAINPGVAQPVGYFQYPEQTYPQMNLQMYPQMYPQMDYNYYPATYPYLWYGR
jgi:hypothetical protein